MEFSSTVSTWLALALVAVLIHGAFGCPSPTEVRSYDNAKTCPRRCCCNATIELVNCTGLYQNLPTAFPYNAKTIYLDRNDMDTFDQENCSTFQQLRFIRELSATNNRLVTINKNCFSGLDNLTMLNLSNNALTSIPTTDRPYPFRTLDLSNNNITTFNKTVLLSMPNLTTLILDNNNIRTLPAKIISDKEKLKILSLRSNGLTTIGEPRPFESTVLLEELYLSDNELTNLPTNWLIGPLNLKVLDLKNATSKRDSTAKDNWQFPGFMETLEEIDLSYNGLRSVRHSVFDATGALQKIDLSHNALQTLPRGLLANLRNLTAFRAQGNQIVDISPAIWGSISSLELINLSSNAIVQIREDTFISLVRLCHLDLSGNKLTSVTFLQLYDFTFLEILRLHNNEISVTPDFSWLTNLHILHLQNNNLAKIPSVQNLSQLEEIDLSANNISVVDTVVFIGANNLKRINLGSNFILTLDSNSLSYLPQSLAWFNLVNNSLICDCNLALITDSLNAYQWGLDLGNLTCASPLVLEGVLVTEAREQKCIGRVRSIKSIILLALLAGIVIALVLLAILYSKYRKIGRTNSHRRRSYPVEQKAGPIQGYHEEAGHLMGGVRNGGSYMDMRASRDPLGSGVVVGSSNKINGSAIKPFGEEYYV